MKFLVIPAVLLLSACGVNTVSNNMSMEQALSTQPDGYTAYDRASKTNYRIISTSVNHKYLCRVVSFDQNNNYGGRTYCKEKGGNWF